MYKKTGSEKGYMLIENLLNTPKKFYEIGSAYNLLEEYFHGFPLTTLKPLLKTEDFWIKRVAVWICSELGYKAEDFLQDIFLLAHDKDFYVSGYALEIICNCVTKENLKYFLWILDGLENEDEKMRILCMGHIKALLPMRIKEVYEYLKEIDGYSIHEKGFLLLLNADDLSENDIATMLCNKNPVYGKYCIIVAHKLYNKYPQIIQNAINNKDSDIKAYSELVVETKRRYDSLDL